MSKGSILAREIQLCQHCGRVLEPYEGCDCRKRLPRDGLRARCGNFVSRSSYMGKSYINCNGRKLRFEDRAARDQYYMDHCCASTQEGCTVRNTSQEVTHGR